MLQNSINIKAETIEEAVQTALNILKCSIEDINVEVIQSPSKSLFGLRKLPAEVKITRITSDNIVKKTTSLEDTPSFEKTDENLEEFIEDFLDSQLVEDDGEKQLNFKLDQKPKFGNSVHTDERLFGVWIQNNKVIVQESAQRLPIIEADKNLKVLVNGQKLTKPQLVTSKDKIIVELEGEVIPSSFWIEVKDNDMMATLSINPGKNIIRNLEETEPQEHLFISAQENITYFTDISIEDVLTQLKSLKIENGIIHSAIHEALNNGEGEAIIAKGTYPVEGLNGDIEILVEGWLEDKGEDDNSDKLEKVDYREGQTILSVEVGEVIAKKIPSILGKPGKDLFDNPVPPKPVSDVIIKVGKGAVQKDDQIVAIATGRPFIESRGKLVKMDVIKEYVHNGDVGLESGNIRFPGDVRITGNVLDSMAVDAEGRIYINGTVNRSIVQSNYSMKIEQNVFSCELSAGKINHVIASLIPILSEILTYSNHILAAINQILMVRRESNPKEETIKLSYLIRLLLEKKYMDFSELTKKLITIINNNENSLDEDWKSLSNTLNKHFINVSKDQNIQLQTLEQFINWMQEMYETYYLAPEPRVAIEVPYAINSTLYSSGNVHIIGQGVYHCNIQADYNIIVKGVCRGGNLSAGNEIFLDDVGSENGGKTTIQVPSNGKIHINYAHADTVIQVGRRIHTFKVGTPNIVASLDINGNLSLYR
ncbi:hypothetical protein SAMN04487786_3751 [Paenisporosarcina quisquiliarum]|nr:hypothetical protein SAMN04487786_3751 [Paenisporosarcina quisquiliarum]